MDRARERHLGAAHGAEAYFWNLTYAMLILARFSLGRVLLHLFAMMGDGAFRFHVAGIVREFVRREQRLA